VLVVLDPIVIVNTAKAPDGPSAKLLTLLAYGRARRFLDQGVAEESQAVADRAGETNWEGKLDGTYSYTAEMYEELERAIPGAASLEPWHLAVSFELLDEVLRRVNQQNEEHQRGIDGETLVATLASHTVKLVRGDWGAVPDYTRAGDVAGNVSIHTGLMGQADLLITRSPSVCPGDRLTPYAAIGNGHGEAALVTSAEASRRLVAAPLMNVVHSLRSQDFNFDAIDASVLERVAPTGEHTAGEWRRPTLGLPPVRRPSRGGIGAKLKAIVSRRSG
jgi:hypothetical protein